MVLKQTTFLFLLTWAVGAAAQPTARQPTGNWIPKFAANHCIASRPYGGAEGPLDLVVEAPPLGDAMQFSVIKKARSVRAQQVDATIRVDQGPPVDTTMLMFSPPNKDVRIYQTIMSPGEFARIRAAKILTVRSDGLKESFALSEMEPILRQMQGCVAELRRVWNITADDASPPLVAQRTKGRLADVFDSEDYPAVSLKAGQSGQTSFVLLIDETGRVAECMITASSGVAGLDAQTCILIRQRASFEPAVGFDGKPAKDSFSQKVRWRVL
ncbi:MAG TPA: energy transducer TonB [Allosphingosinicella sp.]|nr:energy transducer TonB [Allosphingosinicella sp.]